MITLPRAAVWVCAIFLAVAFVFVGILKLEDPSAIRWTERFVNWGYPANTQYVVGVLEILAGLGLLIPKWRRAAAAILVALMIGALGTHAVHAEFLCVRAERSGPGEPGHPLRQYSLRLYPRSSAADPDG